MRRLLWVGGMLVVLGSGDLGRASAQGTEGRPIAQNQLAERRTAPVPEPTIMAVLATSLVGLCLAGLQKRRKG